jgi:hypothetical protein
VIQYGDALLLFRGWQDEKTVLACESSLFSIWGFGMRCTVDSAKDDGVVKLLSIARDAFVELRLSEAEAFEFGRSGAGSEMVFVVLPLRSTSPGLKRDKLTFVEVIDRD